MTEKKTARIIGWLLCFIRHEDDCIGGERGPCNCGLEEARSEANQILEQTDSRYVDRTEVPL